MVRRLPHSYGRPGRRRSLVGEVSTSYSPEFLEDEGPTCPDSSGPVHPVEPFESVSVVLRTGRSEEFPSPDTKSKRESVGTHRVTE